MPLCRYHIRNEYSLGDPELYKVAAKDDPEALLEGVAMAGLIGLLRQLGDLAQFAAEVFHDLHEEVLATASRGHSLIVRVQQLEAEIPSIERTFLTQTSHTSFLYNSGVDWHPNLCMDHNPVTRGDLPRFVMDSYEECRGPPRLFLLDKFDVAGAGACLKRYTDPSFFKTDSILSNGRKSEVQREKKTRRTKKRAPHWRNGDTPESFPSSHAKLHQLFLEERLENGGNEPERRVKLKRRQFTGFFLDQDNKKSYMEKFIDTSPPEQKIAAENDGCELGLEIVEIGTVNPIKQTIKADKCLSSSPDTRELETEPSMGDFSGRKLSEVIDSGALELPGLSCANDACKILKLAKDEGCTDIETDSELSVDDGFASEIDNYMDALAAIESEVDTDSECKKPSGYFNAKPAVADLYGSEGQREPQSLFSDSQSVGNSTTSEDCNNFFKDRDSSCSRSVNSLAESTTDLDAAAMVVPCLPAKSDPDDMSFNHHFMSKGIPGSEIEEHTIASNVAVEADEFPVSTQDPGETSKTSCRTDPKTNILPIDMEDSLDKNCLPSPELDEEYSNFADPGIHILASQSAPKRTDSGHLSSGELSLRDEASQSPAVHPGASHDLLNTPGDLVHLPQVESRKAAFVSLSVEEHINRLDMADFSACAAIRQPLAHSPISDAKYVETMNPIDAAPNVDFFISSTRENSEDQYQAPECTQSIDFQEKLSETNNIDHALLFDSASEAVLSSQYHSINETSDLEATEKAWPAPVAGVAETLPPISNAVQAHALQSSSSDIAEAAETADNGFLEAAKLGNLSSGDEPNSKVISGFTDKDIGNSSIATGETYLGPVFQCLNLASEVAEAAPLECHRAEADKECPGNSSNVYGGSVSVGKNDQDATLNASILERVSASQNVTLICHDREEPVGTYTYLDSGTRAVQIDVASEHEYSTKHGEHGDESRGFSYDVLPSDIPKLVMTSNFVSTAWNNSTSYHDVGKLKHIETAAHGCRLVGAENNLQENALHPSSYESLHAEKLKDAHVSLTEECRQNKEEPGLNANLTSKKDLDTAQDAPVSSHTDMSSDGSASLTRLDGSLADDVQSCAEVAYGLEAPLIFENGTHDTESTSSYHIHSINRKESYVDSRSHDKPKSLVHFHDGDSVKPLHADEVSSQSINYTKQIQTVEHFDRVECLSTAALYSHPQPPVLNPQPQSAVCTLESSRQPSVKSSSVCHSNGLSATSQAIQNPGQLVCPSFPVLDMLPSQPPINLEPPPLPPLPPMQWRLGRFQNISTAAERQMVWHTPRPVQPMALQTHNAKTETIATSRKTEGQRGCSNGNVAQQGVLSLPVPDGYSHNSTIGIVGEEGNHSLAGAQTSISSLNGNQSLEDSCQSSVNAPESKSVVEAYATGNCPAVAEENVSTEISAENGQPENISQATEQDLMNSHGEIAESLTVQNEWHPQLGFVAPQTGSTSPSIHDGVSAIKNGNADGTLELKPARPRNPLIDEVVAVDKSKLRKVDRVKTPVESKLEDGESLLQQLQLKKVGERTKPLGESKTEEIGLPLEQLLLRKVGERVKPQIELQPEETESPRVQLRKVGEGVKSQIELQPEETESPRVQLRKVVGRAHSLVGPKNEDRDSLLEQIRNKSFNLRPAVSARPNMQGPRTNLKVAAILQKASNIRQAMAGSDEEDDTDNWSDC